MRIDRMLFANFAPFAAGGIVFPQVPDRSGAEVHLLVGENGTGKTRLLCLLLRALGNDAELKARVDDPTGLRTLVSAEVGNMFGFYSANGAFITDQLSSRQALLQFAGMPEDVLPQHLIAKFPPRPGIQFVFETPQECQVSSLLENPGGRLAEKSVALSYKGTASISDAEVSSMKAVPAGPLAGDLVFQKDPNESEVIGQLMVNLKLASAMDMLQGDTDGRNIRLVDRLERTLSEITGRRFSFRVIDSPKVELRVDWGEKRRMRISQLPDGLRSIIGWLVSCSARLCMHLPDEPAPLDHPFVLILDEPEGNLHPAWQRKILPATQSLFRNAQIIAATHSPWVVSSVNEGFIHILRFNAAEEVVVDQPKPCEKGDSYIDVVEDVLGVKEWFDPETERLMAEFRALRDDGGAWDALERLAGEIAGRGRYLAELMGREMAGIRRKHQPLAAK